MAKGNHKKTLSSTLLCSFLFITSLAFSQSDILKHARFIIDTLSSPSMHGRGYVNKGDSLVANYIAHEFAKLHLAFFGKDYYQHFKLSVNTFPNNADIQIDSKKLFAGKDFLVEPASCSCKGKKQLVFINQAKLKDKVFISSLEKLNFRKKALLIDTAGGITLHRIDLLKEELQYFGKPIFMVTDAKLTHSLSTIQKGNCEFIIQKKSLPELPKKVSYSLNAELKNNYTSQNIIGAIKGSQTPDSFIVFSAHYDHLGQLGKDAYFPGANDNASGCAMLLTLAEYYSVLQPKYSLIFMAFGGEEAGLVGSKYFVENQLFNINKIKFMINMDIVGTGDEGIKVVNATKHKQYFERLVQLNNDKKLLPAVLPRGKAANSDHYFFSEAGVPAFFIYTLSGIKAYHDVYDQPKTLPLTKFQELFELLTAFADSF